MLSLDSEAEAEDKPTLFAMSPREARPRRGPGAAGRRRLRQRTLSRDLVKGPKADTDAGRGGITSLGKIQLQMRFKSSLQITRNRLETGGSTPGRSPRERLEAAETRGELRRRPRDSGEQQLEQQGLEHKLHAAVAHSVAVRRKAETDAVNEVFSNDLAAMNTAALVKVAIKLQAIARRKRAQRRVGGLREQKAATVIQSWMRVKRARAVRQGKVAEVKATLLMQSHIRRRVSAREVQVLRGQRDGVRDAAAQAQREKEMALFKERQMSMYKMNWKMKKIQDASENFDSSSEEEGRPHPAVKPRKLKPRRSPRVPGGPAPKQHGGPLITRRAAMLPPVKMAAQQGQPKRRSAALDKWVAKAKVVKTIVGFGGAITTRKKQVLEDVVVKFSPRQQKLLDEGRGAGAGVGGQGGGRGRVKGAGAALRWRTKVQNQNRRRA